MRTAESRLLSIAKDLYDQFQKGMPPYLVLPSRTKKNIEYSAKDDVWVYGDQESVRSVKTIRGPGPF